MTIAVRPARATELPALAAAVAGQPLLRRYGTTADGLAARLAEALARGEEVVVAEDADGACGLAWFLRGGTFGLGGYLRLIALCPGRERRGAGAALMDEVERRVAEASRHLFLLVTADNEGARRFYERRGYVAAGALPALVRPGLDELILWKRLGG